MARRILLAQDDSDSNAVLAKRQMSKEDQLDACREMVNIAMGRAGENLAQLLGEFIDLPIPNVNLIESNELSMAVAEINRNDSVLVKV